jgi:intein/homing endonuclease
MEIETGTKKNIIIPTKLKKSKKLVRSFIAGFFDAEGSVNLQKNNLTCQISLAQKQKRILEEIQKELEKDRIPTKLRKAGENIYTLYGNKASLSPFLQKIPFVHPKKRKKLETAVKNQTKFFACCNNPARHFPVPISE